MRTTLRIGDRMREYRYWSNVTNKDTYDIKEMRKIVRNIIPNARQSAEIMADVYEKDGRSHTYQYTIPVGLILWNGRNYIWYEEYEVRTKKGTTKHVDKTKAWFISPNGSIKRVYSQKYTR